MEGTIKSEKRPQREGDVRHGDGREATWNMWNLESRTFHVCRTLVPDFHLERGAHGSGTDLERSLSVSLELFTRLERSGTIFAGTQCNNFFVDAREAFSPAGMTNKCCFHIGAFPKFEIDINIKT
jgi:hypothetical protein